MMNSLDEFLNDIFHSCALAAYVDISQENKTNQPDSKQVKQRAYQYYEKYKRGNYETQSS